MVYLQALVVEGTAPLAAKTLSVLKRIGINAHHAVSGQDALAFLDQKQPDIILLSIALDDVSGWELMAKARARYGEANAPMLVTTAYTEDSQRHAHHWRPFAAQHLIDTIGHVLEIRKVR
ncbi:MAG: hypothetical protein OHK0046_14670 [Anaerolineae bacterium]